MSYFEVLSVLVATLALVISLVVWNGQRRLQKESNELQRATAELSRRQLETLEKEEAASRVANLTLELERQGNGYALLLTNFGPAIAREVTLAPTTEAVEASLVVPDQVQAKFPADRLLPGTRIALIARVYLGAPAEYSFRVTWQDGTGERSEVMRVSL